MIPEPLNMSDVQEAVAQQQQVESPLACASPQQEKRSASGFKGAISKIFSNSWSSDSTSSPEGNSLIAAFRAMMPKGSQSGSGATADGCFRARRLPDPSCTNGLHVASLSVLLTHTHTHPQHPGSGLSRFNSSIDASRSSSAYMAPPPISPGRRSTLLAICQQLPPSMQRAEWCLDDYIITDKLYKGYASMGECVHGGRGGSARCCHMQDWGRQPSLVVSLWLQHAPGVQHTAQHGASTGPACVLS
jgi:hypothetical protein